jgi:hypothetical protein
VPASAETAGSNPGSNAESIGASTAGPR